MGTVISCVWVVFDDKGATLLEIKKSFRDVDNILSKICLLITFINPILFVLLGTHTLK